MLPVRGGQRGLEAARAHHRAHMCAPGALAILLNPAHHQAIARRIIDTMRIDANRAILCAILHRSVQAMLSNPFFFPPAAPPIRAHLGKHPAFAILAPDNRKHVAIGTCVANNAARPDLLGKELIGAQRLLRPGPTNDALIEGCRASRISPLMNKDGALPLMLTIFKDGHRAAIARSAPRHLNAPLITDAIGIGYMIGRTGNKQHMHPPGGIHCGIQHIPLETKASREAPSLSIGTRHHIHVQIPIDAPSAVDHVKGSIRSNERSNTAGKFLQIARPHGSGIDRLRRLPPLAIKGPHPDDAIIIDRQAIVAMCAPGCPRTHRAGTLRRDAPTTNPSGRIAQLHHATAAAATGRLWRFTRTGGCNGR